MKESEWIAIRSASKAMKSAMSVINGNADERAIYEQTLEYMATDVGNKIGEMERFLEVSQNVLAGIDLQQDVFSDKGLKELEEWGKQPTRGSWAMKSRSSLQLLQTITMSPPLGERRSTQITQKCSRSCNN